MDRFCAIGFTVSLCPDLETVVPLSLYPCPAFWDSRPGNVSQDANKKTSYFTEIICNYYKFSVTLTNFAHKFVINAHHFQKINSFFTCILADRSFL